MTTLHSTLRIAGCWFTVLVTAGLVAGCGADAEGSANPGSETHWLSRCTSDADCGEGSCLCGICSRGCETDADCDFATDHDGCSDGDEECRGSQQAACLLSSSLDRCAKVPQRICAADTGQARAVDAGDEASDAAVPTETSDAATQSGLVQPSRLSDGGLQSQSSGSGLQSQPSDNDTQSQRSDSGLQSQPSDSGLQSQPSDSSLQSRSAICDGSDEVRFAMAHNESHIDGWAIFTSAYAKRFLAIDGHCTAWTANDSDGKVVVSQLELDIARELEDLLSFGALDAFADYESQACSDTSTTVLADPSGTTVCKCDCAAQDAPAGWSTAFETAFMLQEELFFAGGEQTETVSIVLLDDGGEQPGVPWPLDWDPTEHFYVAPPDSEDPPDPGLSILDPNEVSALRDARQVYEATETYQNNPTPYMQFEYATDTASIPIRAYLRDDAPDHVKETVERTIQAGYAPLGRPCEDNDDCRPGFCIDAEDEDGALTEAFCWGCLTDNHREAGYACNDDDDCCDGFECCEDCDGTCVAR